MIVSFSLSLSLFRSFCVTQPTRGLLKKKKKEGEVENRIRKSDARGDCNLEMHARYADCRQCNRPKGTTEGSFYPPPVAAAAIGGLESNLRDFIVKVWNLVSQLSVLFSSWLRRASNTKRTSKRRYTVNIDIS